MLRLIPIIFIVSLAACKKPSQNTLFSLLDKTGIDFTNTITETKDLNVFKYRNFYNGGGVATGDLNNDGLPEVFFTANQSANKLYLNKGNFVFEDISAKAGFTEKNRWGTGVVFVDINADGWLDIYVCNAGNMFDSSLRRNQLFINNHNLTFTEKAKEYGLDNDGYSTQASFFDYDLDGDLDCFVVNNSPIPVNTLNHTNMRDLPAKDWQVAVFLKGGGDHLYRNDSNHFTEVTKEAGIHGGLISLGLGVTVGDVNADGYPDVYVSNDFFERDYLYINQRNGSFKDELELYMQHTSLSSMGADIQDINNDGSPDIFTTDMLPSDDYRLKANTSFEGYDIFKLKQSEGFYNQFTQNALQVNNGRGKFLETAFYSGVAASDWSWGGLMFDADNDGLQDIYVCNGIYRDVTDQDFIDFFANEVVQQMMISGKKEEAATITSKMPSMPIPNMMFRNKGGLKFKDEAGEWGLGTPSFSNGAVYADLDNDGDLDIVVNNVNQEAFVYRNNSREQNKNNYIALSLQYTPPNLFGIGSTIRVYQGNEIISREIMPSRGFQSSVDYKQTIGLGKLEPDSITVTWPNGTASSIARPAINQWHKINYTTSAKKKPVATAAFSNYLFEKLPVSFDKHIEDNYVDFYYERNIPFMLSRQGPKAATGDVNGDGLEDIFIGGARDFPSQLYVQSGAGFVKKEVPDFKTYSFDDITGAFFFDCEKDGDLDLFTSGGGNFSPASSGSFQNQLYVNDGKGNFLLKRGGFPITNINCGAAIPLDFDGDGYLDIFAAGRSVPQDYGLDAKSFLYRNDGKGNFTDVTASVAPLLLKAGMVTAAAYDDMNGDGKKDLIIAGEWMYPHAYSFNGQQFEEVKTGIENYFGWWQAMVVTDIDKDGDMDLVLGNMGQNFYLQPDSAHPVKLWISDFDQNGTTDKVFSKTLGGKDIPVFTKREITEQLPSLKKLNLRHHDYATKTVGQLFEKAIDGTAVKQVNYAASCIAYNDGKGHFTIKELPAAVQLSCINAMLIKDVDRDGYPDIIAAGNNVDLLPQFCRVDASYGHVLINDKKGRFVEMKLSGIEIAGEARDIIAVKKSKDDCLLFLLNSDFPAMYKIKSN